MKKKTKFTIAAVASASVGAIVYLAEKAAKKIVKNNPIEEIELNDFKETRIKNKAGNIITGYFANHHQDTTMIMIHPLASCGVDMISYYDYFKDKIQANYLLIDLSGYGKSEGDHIYLDETYEDDLICWVEYLRRNNTQSIILYGKQMGANVILNSLKELHHYQEIKCIISDGATASNEQMIQDEVNQMYPLIHRTVAFVTKLILKYQYRIPFKHLYILDNLKEYDRPILFIQSRNDHLVQFKRVFNIYNAKKDQKELVLLKDAAYLFEYNDENDPYYSVMLDFIHSKL